jgi:uncharacterized protein with HEPN domain
MLPESNRDILKVKDILHAISLIKSFVEKENLQTFINSNLVQSAVIRQFEIIGEAGNKISADTQNTFPEIPWRSIRSFRNLLIHEYFKVDAAEVWTTIQNDLTALEEQMKVVLKFIQSK